MRIRRRTGRGVRRAIWTKPGLPCFSRGKTKKGVRGEMYNAAITSYPTIKARSVMYVGRRAQKKENWTKESQRGTRNDNAVGGGGPKGTE